MLFDSSEEGAEGGGPNIPCLGWIPGTVRRFPETVRVPQIGWNLLSFTHEHPLTHGVPPENSYTYFVNSYFADPANPDDVIATANYAGDFTAMVAHENIAAAQFHAEKSGELGLRILSNFAMEPTMTGTSGLASSRSPHETAHCLLRREERVG